MANPAQALLKVLAVVVGLLFFAGVVLTAGELFFFGSSKVRPLFGMSADALEGQAARRHAHDGGPVSADAGALY